MATPTNTRAIPSGTSSSWPKTNQFLSPNSMAIYRGLSGSSKVRSTSSILPIMCSIFNWRLQLKRRTNFLNGYRNSRKHRSSPMRKKRKESDAAQAKFKENLFARSKTVINHTEPRGRWPNTCGSNILKFNTMASAHKSNWRRIKLNYSKLRSPATRLHNNDTSLFFIQKTVHQNFPTSLIFSY